MSNEVSVDEALRLHALYREAHPNDDARTIGARVYDELRSRLPTGERTAEQRDALEDASHDAEAILNARSMHAALFLVWGTEGSHSDRSEWPIRAYPTYDAARACVLRLRAHCRAHRSPDGYDSYDLIPSAPDDPSRRIGYDTPHYYVVAIPLGDAP